MTDDQYLELAREAGVQTDGPVISFMHPEFIALCKAVYNEGFKDGHAQGCHDMDINENR